MEKDKDSLIISTIESKPHKMYIRYLLVQRYSPGKIKSELVSLGLSAPHEGPLERYFFMVIDPLIKKHKLGYLYAAYKDRMMVKKEENKGKKFSLVLNFKEEIMKDPETEIRFLRFISELGVIETFGPELLRLYGKLENVPNDPETGKSFTEHLTRYKEMPWDVVDSPFRHIIEELLIEGMDNNGIVAHMDTHYNVRVRPSAIVLYSKIFFSVERFDKTSQLKVMLAERENLFHDIRQIDNWIAESDRGSYKGDKTMPQLMQDRKSLYSRTQGLDTTIKAMQAQTSEVAVKQTQSLNDGYVEMFQDMMDITYSKFKRLAVMNDRGIVEPLYKLTRMAQNSYEMLVKAKENALKGNTMNQAEMIRMVTERENDNMDDQIKALEISSGFDPQNLIGSVDIDPRIIEGLEELMKEEEDDDNGED